MPYFDDISYQLSERRKNRNHVKKFILLPSKIFSKSYSIEEIAKSQQAKYQSQMTNDGCHFLSKLKTSYNFWKDKVEHQQDQPNSVIETLQFTDLDFFPNIPRLLLILAVWPIGSTEPEKAASGLRRLKIGLCSEISDQQESDLNPLQMQQITTVNVDRVADMFSKQHHRSLFNSTIFSE